MKLIRFGQANNERPGLILPDGRWIDASPFGEDYDENFFRNDGLARLQSWANQHAAQASTIDPSTRLAPPLSRPGKIICVGLNYSDHAAESGFDEPKEPILFFKATTAICGPNDDLILPRGSEKTDWEVELAIVIGKKAKYVNEADALDHVAGYMLHNDYSEREYQLERGGQWVKGKSCDTFAPIGPFMATRDEIADPHNLDLSLSVNGEQLQNSNTKNLIFNIPTLVSYISQFMTMLPGDIISTGTPAGVGLGLKPPRFLKAGDVVELQISHLGQSRQVVKAG